MKKVFLAAVTLISVAFVGTANAQDSNTGTATVNIKLKGIHTLTVNPTQSIVNLEYITKDDYNDGVGVTQANHLKIFSTGAFEIKVKANDNFISSVGSNTETINASTVTVTPSAGSGDGSKPITGTPNYTPQNLGVGEDKEIVSNSTGGRDFTINVNYKGAGADAYLDKFNKSRNSSELNVFTTQVTYTILAK